MDPKWRESLKAFTLIELMIVVAIIGVIAAIAIPSYLGYLRRSYLSEVSSSISNIKSAEESYFSTHGCYIAASAHPTSIPPGRSVDWDTPSPASVWGQSGLSVRPDRHVRFQYEVIGSNSWASGTACGSSGSDRDTSVGCVTVNAIAPNSIFPTNWYVVIARGDLNNNGVSSNIVSAIDDSTIIYCNEIE